jgi:hypothetical protein
MHGVIYNIFDQRVGTFKESKGVFILEMQAPLHFKIELPQFEQLSLPFDSRECTVWNSTLTKPLYRVWFCEATKCIHIAHLTGGLAGLSSVLNGTPTLGPKDFDGAIQTARHLAHGLTYLFFELAKAGRYAAYFPNR